MGQHIAADDYILYFRFMIELKNEKVTFTTLDLIEVG